MKVNVFALLIFVLCTILYIPISSIDASGVSLSRWKEAVDAGLSDVLRSDLDYDVEVCSQITAVQRSAECKTGGNAHETCSNFIGYLLTQNMAPGQNGWHLPSLTIASTEFGLSLKAFPMGVTKSNACAMNYTKEINWMKDSTHSSFGNKSKIHIYKKTLPALKEIIQSCTIAQYSKAHLLDREQRSELSEEDLRFIFQSNFKVDAQVAMSFYGLNSYKELLQKFYSQYDGQKAVCASACESGDQSPGCGLIKCVRIPPRSMKMPFCETILAHNVARIGFSKKSMYLKPVFRFFAGAESKLVGEVQYLEDRKDYALVLADKIYHMSAKLQGDFICARLNSVGSLEYSRDLGCVPRGILEEPKLRVSKERLHVSYPKSDIEFNLPIPKSNLDLVMRPAVYRTEVLGKAFDTYLMSSKPSKGIFRICSKEDGSPQILETECGTDSTDLGITVYDKGNDQADHVCLREDLTDVYVRLQDVQRDSAIKKKIDFGYFFEAIKPTASKKYYLEDLSQEMIDSFVHLGGNMFLREGGYYQVTKDANRDPVSSSIRAPSFMFRTSGGRTFCRRLKS